MTEENKNIEGRGSHFISDEEYEDAIYKAHGIVAEIARILGIRRTAVQGKLKNNPELKKLVIEERKNIIDMANNVLYRCLEKDSIPAAIFTLKTIGGWAETQNINLNIDDEEDAEDYDLSVLNPEELAELQRLNAKIYKPRNAE